MNSLMMTLAWRPFLEPLMFFQEHWYWLLPPLAFVVSLVWKTLKLPTLEGLWVETFKLTATIVLAMVGAGLFLWLLTESV